jgi:hypothetical protein
MKYKMDFHGIWKFELDNHNIDFFFNGEWIQCLVIQFP